jgi:hypothetical protein
MQDVSNYGTSPGSEVWLYHCTGATNQQWKLNQVAGGYQIINPVSGLCLDAGTRVTACSVLPGQNMPFCDPSQPLSVSYDVQVLRSYIYQYLALQVRVQNIIDNIPQNEVFGLFNTQSGGVGALNIPSYQWWSEALHGIAGSPGVNFGGPFPGATSFPHVCTSSMSFNRTLWHAIGGVIGVEGRAMNNGNQAGNTFWAP